jgi:hypothetical protein
LEQQKERISTYQIQARFALASIYDRAAIGGGAVKTPESGAPSESQGELEVVQPDAQAPAEGAPAPAESAPPAGDVPPPATDPATMEPGVSTSPPPEAPK